MKTKKLLSLVLAGTLALSLTACGGSDDAVASIKKKGTITMVTNASFEPFEYKDGDTVIGIDAEIGQAIADDLGVKLEIQDIDFNSCIPSLTSGKADFCAAGMSVTEERKKNVDFTDTYFDASQMILVGSDSTIAGGSDINDKTVGVQQGTTGDTYVTNEDGSNDVKVKEVKRYTKLTDAVSDLTAGRIDAVVGDNFPLKKLQANNPETSKLLDDALTTETYAIAVPKGSNLKDEINSLLKKMQGDGSLEEIFSKYISE